MVNKLLDEQGEEVEIRARRSLKENIKGDGSGAIRKGEGARGVEGQSVWGPTEKQQQAGTAEGKQ